MAFAALHSALDELAVWTEDRRRRTPEPCRLVPPAPLDCDGPLPPLPRPPAGAGWWSAPSPRPQREGDRLLVEVTPAAAPRRGTALLVPPWKIDRTALVGGYRRLLAAAGYEVWLVCPPHHLARALPGARSGEGFLTLDVARLRATFEQLVVELRLLAALAAPRGAVGLVGLSLGGLAGALAAGAPERLTWAALVAPAHLGLALTHTCIGARYRRLAAPAHAAAPTWPGDAAVAAALAPFDPARRPPRAGRLLLALGAHDRIAPPAGGLALARAWRVTPHVYPRGHMTLLFLCRALRRDLRALAEEAPLTAASPSPS